MLDRDLEQRLRGYFATEVGADAASSSLVARVTAIPDARPASPIFGDRRTVVLLAAAALLLALVLGTALAVGSGLVMLPWTSRETVPSPAPSELEGSLPLPAGHLQPGVRYQAGFGFGPSPIEFSFAVPVGSGSWDLSRLDSDGLGVQRPNAFLEMEIPDGVYRDPCRRLQGTDRAETVDDFISKLRMSLERVPGLSVASSGSSEIGGRRSSDLVITIDPASLPQCDLRTILLWSLASDTDGVPEQLPGAARQVLDGTVTELWGSGPDGWRVAQRGSEATTVHVVDVRGAPVVLVDSSSAGGDAGPAEALAELVASIQWPTEPLGVVRSTEQSPCDAENVQPVPLERCYLRPGTLYSASVGVGGRRVKVGLQVPEPIIFVVWQEADSIQVVDPVLPARVAGAGVAVEIPAEVYPDPCHPTDGYTTAGKTVDQLTGELRDALSGIPGAIVGLPVDTAIGELPARKLTIEVDSATAQAGPSCANQVWRLANLSSSYDGFIFNQTSPSTRTYQLFVLDVRDTPVVVVADYDGHATDRPAAIASILASLSWK
jgi:hypothetical protein